MSSDLESASSKLPEKERPDMPKWIKVGVFAAASALAGGLAAAWYYRNTLTRLKQAENRDLESGSGASYSDSGDDD